MTLEHIAFFPDNRRSAPQVSQLSGSNDIYRACAQGENLLDAKHGFQAGSRRSFTQKGATMSSISFSDRCELSRSLKPSRNQQPQYDAKFRLTSSKSTGSAAKGFLPLSVELVDTRVPSSLAAFSCQSAVAEHASAIVSHCYSCFSRRQFLRTLALTMFRTTDRPPLPFFL